MCTENHLHFDYVRLAWDAGFCFEEYNTKNVFDISTLGLVDIEKVTRERDIATVERHIPTILQFHLDEELTRILEPTFVKIFKLCQLALQYLRFCNKYLDNTVIILKKDLSASNDENINLSNLIDQLKAENNNLNIKHKELKETFNHINQTVSFKCHDCSKSFASEEYLQSHISRRHDSQTAQMQSESEKLQMEIKELKERLNSTEKYIIHNENEKDEPNNDDVFADKEAVLQAKFEQLKEHIEKELSLLRDESFYKGIYEKWFEEVYEKLKGAKKVFVEQGSGDCVRLTESSTQTNSEEYFGENESIEGYVRITNESREGNVRITNESGEGNVRMTNESRKKNVRITNESEEGNVRISNEMDGDYERKASERERKENGRGEETKGVSNERYEEIEGRTIGRIEEIEEKLRVENEAQREMLEKLLEQKIVGSLGKLESQINDFGKILQHFEMKKQETPKPIEAETSEKRESKTNITQQHPTLAKVTENRDSNTKVTKQHVTPTKTNTRYIVAKSATKVATSSDSESENLPPKKERKINRLRRASVSSVLRLM